MNAICEYKSENLRDSDFGIMIDVSFDSNNGVFRRYPMGNNALNWVDPFGLARKPGKTPPSRWPQLPKNLAGKKPKWNPEGYWEGTGNGRYSWDDRSHGAGVDRGDGPQEGHWDDENSDDRYDPNGNRLPCSAERDWRPSIPPLKPEKISPWWLLLLFIPFPGNPIYGGL